MFGTRRLLTAFPLFTLLLALAGPLPAAAQEAAAALPAGKTDAVATEPAIPNSRCLGCHDDAEMKSDDGKSLAVLADHFNLSAHRKLDCAECHDAALTTKHPKNPLGAVKPQVCQSCHEDEFKAVAGSIHGRCAKGDRAIKDCNGCHGSLHTVHKSGDPNSPLSPVTRSRPAAVATKT